MLNVENTSLNMLNVVERYIKIFYLAQKPTFVEQ